ncbi:MAG: hypothetical protein ACFFG0_43075 [Candidatus Thorarchaeota archaeon]
MTSKKYLSNKKTSKQTISISPALKDWVKRYVNVSRRKYPNDKRFKSVSTFYTSVMWKVLELFEKGKSLDDFERVLDKEVEDFFEDFTFRATIPLYEMVSKSNRYVPFSFEFVTHFILTYFKFLKRQIKSGTYNELNILIERLKTRVNLSNISKEWTMELIVDENNGPARGVLEFIGTNRNLHYENCKFFAGILGFLGVRVTDFIYSPEDYYGRLDLIETDLLFRKDLAKKERLSLLEDNVRFIINYDRMLDDKELYLWMNLSEDNELYISFRNKNAFNKWIKIIEKDLTKFGIRDNFLTKILLFFNKIHWIRIENLKTLSFQIEDFIERNQKQKQLIMNHLSNYSEISQNNGIYYLS